MLRNNHRPSNPTPERARHRPFVETSSTMTASEDAPPEPVPHSSSSSSLLFCRSPFRQFFLLFALLFYQFAGALLFLICEAGEQREREEHWELELAEKRRLLVDKVAEEVQHLRMANNNESQGQLGQLFEQSLLSSLAGHDRMLLEWRGKHPQMRWDFWNAMLFSLSIFTTIGYGHLYARTRAGRVLTMLYALGGIPLLMLVLDELGTFLNRALRAAWFLLKCACRRAFRNCTRQTPQEIRSLDAEDKHELRSPVELPLAVALLALFAWICLCATLSCLWERHWDFPTAFYFFFTSLSTIGLGDIVPSRPAYSLMLTTFVIVGLALVSMCVGLVQSKYARASTSQQHLLFNDALDANDIQSDVPTFRANRLLQRHPCGSSLGVFSTMTSSSRGSAVRERLRQRQWHNKCTQTLLSFPSGAIRNARVTRTITQNGLKMLPRTLSIDDVMRLVDTEEGDILLLSELSLSRDVSGLSAEMNAIEGRASSSTTSAASESAAGRVWSSESENSLRTTTSSSGGEEGTTHWECRGHGQQQQMMVVSRSFDRCHPNPVPMPTPQLPQITQADIPLVFPIFSSLLRAHHQPTPNTMTELELLEELEDRMVLSHGEDNSTRSEAYGNCPRATYNDGGTANPGAGVHFRSRLSLIPEQRSVDEETEKDVAQSSLAYSPGMAGTTYVLEETATDSDSRRSEARIDLERAVQMRPVNTSSWSGGLSALIKGDFWKKKGGRRSASLTDASEERKGDG